MLQFAKGFNAMMLSCVLLLFAAGCSEDKEAPPVFKPIDLNLFSQTHKGFNLLGKFDAGWSNTGFSEKEFEIIKDLGFFFQGCRSITELIQMQETGMNFRRDVQK